MNYYISDLHLGHANIMRLSKRNFSSVDEMDKAIIDNWNSRVRDDDDVYILGDLCYKNGKLPREYLSQLNGKKHLIVGNHDSSLLRDKFNKKFFVSIDDILTVHDGKETIVLCHYPLVEWNGYFRGTKHFYGHVHNNVENDTYKILATIPNMYNVGVDVLDFTPRTFKEVVSFNEKFLKEHF